MQIETILNNLTNGPSLYMAYEGSKARAALDKERLNRGRLAFSSVNWQHIANGIADPLGPCPASMRTMAKFIKRQVWHELNSPWRLEQLLYICSLLPATTPEQKNALAGMPAFYDKLRRDWDWQMFANGLVAEN